MLDLNPEIVCNVIAKARMIGIKDDLVMPGESTSPSDFDWTEALAEERLTKFGYSYEQ